MIARTALICLFVLAGPAPSFAEVASEEQGAAQPSIAGHWSFQSETYEGCDFGGTAYFAPQEGEQAMTCELTARQSCVTYEWVVRQSCLASRTGNRIVVESQIEEFLVGEPSDSYWPDNFILKVESGNRMVGVLVSHGTHPTEFVRRVDGIS